MKPTPLPLVEKTCGIEIEELMPEILEGRAPLQNVLYFCTMLRRRGVAKLFLSGLPDGLFVDLYKSGRAFLDYLERRGDEEKRTSLSAPLFDAVVCNDLEGAKGIAARSRRTLNVGAEYEEDFLGTFLLMQRFFLDAPPRVWEMGLRRYAELAEAAEDARLAICTGLLRGEQETFDRGLEAFLRGAESRYEAGMEQEDLDPDDAATTARVSIEGAALVQMARLAGLRTAGEYALVPDVLLLHHRSRLPAPDAWKVIESYRELG